jgi:DNA-cytosine methyltransferase
MPTKLQKILNENTIFLGDVLKVSYQNGILEGENQSYKTKIDILFFGFPCQDFSIMGNRLNFEGERGKLFFEALRIYRSILKENPDLIFLAENVKMSKRIKEAISQELGFRCVEINSSLVSWQSRGRLYWTNIQPGNQDLFGIVTPNIPQPKDLNMKLVDILQKDAPEKYFLTEKAAKYILNPIRLAKKHTSVSLDKSLPFTAKGIMNNTGTFILQRAHGFKNISFFTEKCPTTTSKSWQHNNFVCEKDDNGKAIFDGYRIRRLTPWEVLKLQTIPDWAIEILLNSGISDAQIYKMAGNGWTNNVIMHILKQEKRLC